jgi:hypothetical protein
VQTSFGNGDRADRGILGLEQLAQAHGALRSRRNQPHDPLGEFREGLRDRQQVLSLQVPVGEKLQHRSSIGTPR